MNIIDQYIALADAEQWSDALPLITEITKRDPSIPTSWFNYGVCLAGLGRHQEAADKFLKAYSLDPEDFGAQYRAFRSLFDAADYARFLRLARSECERMPSLIRNLVSDPDFGPLFTRPDFQKLRQDFEE